MPHRHHALVLLAALAAAACSTPPAFALGGLVDVQVVDRSRDAVLTTWRHRGESYVAGRPGDRYAVRLTNRTGGRVLIVLSVDGVNAVSGETAATGQAGYVLAPWQTADINGWRKSEAEAAAFYFTALPDSYAARTGRPDNVGVIGAAVFRERVAPPPPAPPALSRQRSSPRDDALGDSVRERRAEVGSDSTRASGRAANADSAPAASPPARESEDKLAAKLGTGHGEREYAPVTLTAFERASQRPQEVVAIRYDSHANLLAAGIIGRPARPPLAEPFPRFVPDPR